MRQFEFNVKIFSDIDFFNYYKDIFNEYNIKIFQEASTKNKLWTIFNPLHYNEEIEGDISLFVIDADTLKPEKTNDILKELSLSNQNCEIFIINNNIYDISKDLEKYTSPDKLVYLEKPVSKYTFFQTCSHMCHKHSLRKKQKTFLSSVTHELMTPLNAILGFSEILNDTTEEADSKNMLDIIHTQGKRIKRIMYNLIYINSPSEKIFADKIFQVKKIKENVLRNLKDYYDSDNFKRIVWESKSDYIFIKGDLAKLSLAIENIIGNGLFFSIESGEDVFIKIEEDNENIYISVIDKGIGMINQNLQHIFELFYRAEDTHHNSPGMGVGLYIAKDIITSHNGNILVDSEIEKGSHFKIILPKN